MTLSRRRSNGSSASSWLPSHQMRASEAGSRTMNLSLRRAAGVRAGVDDHRAALGDPRLAARDRVLVEHRRRRVPDRRRRSASMPWPERSTLPADVHGRHRLLSFLVASVTNGRAHLAAARSARSYRMRRERRLAERRGRGAAALEQATSTPSSSASTATRRSPAGSTRCRSRTRRRTPWPTSRGHRRDRRSPSPTRRRAGVLGSIGVRWNERRDVGEIGYWLRADARGRGVDHARARARLAMGVRREGASRACSCAPTSRTSASRRVAEKAGFTREGVLRSAHWNARLGRRQDWVMYSLLPGDVE